MPALDALLPSFDDPLQYDGDAAADAAFTLAGRRALVVGGEARGTDAIRVGPRRILRDLRIEGAATHGFRATPIGLERRLRVGGRDVVERIFVPRDLAATIVEWQAPEGAELALSWRTDLQGAEGGAASTCERLTREHEGRVFRVRSGDDVVAFVLSGEPAAWEAADVRGADGPALDIRLRLGLGAGASVRLAMAATTRGDDDLVTILASLRPDALVRARRAARRVLQRERLMISAPDTRVGVALEWAKVRLDALHAERSAAGQWLLTGDPAVVMAREPAGGAAAGDAMADRATAGGRVGVHSAGAGVAGGLAGVIVPGDPADGGPAGVFDPGAAAQAALAALICGDFDTARSVILALGELQSPSGRRQREASAGGGPPGEAPASAGAPGIPPDPTLGYLLLVARYVAWTGELGLVREEWDRVRSAYVRAFQGGDGVQAKPDRPAGEFVEWLGGGAAARTGDRVARWTDASLRDAVRRELAATAESVGLALPETVTVDPAGRSGAAGPGGGGRLDGPFGHRPYAQEGEGVTADAAAVTVASWLAHGLLGAEPDAAKGRLRLRPAIPEAWDRLDVRQLRIGDASIDIAYRRDGDRHTFRLDQTSGAVPVTLIFEPLLAARRLVSATVDGQPAELDPRPHGRRMLVPVQLVLDAERVIELEVSQEPGPQPRGLRVWRQ